MLELVTTEMLIQVALSSGLFLLLWAILSRGVFKHFIEVIEEREARTTGDDSQAKDFERDAASLNKQLDNALLDIKISALRARDAITQQADAQATKIIDQAKDQAQAQIAASRAEIASLRARLEAELTTQTDVLASKLAKKVVEQQQITVH